MTPRLAGVAVALVVLSVVAPFGVGTAAAQTGGCSFPLSETDATGTTVSLSGPPDSIVTLNPSAAQTIFEISSSADPAWDRVVGVSQFASYLPGTSSKTTVGNGRSDATVERTIALSPDLVLAPNTIPTSTVEQLREAGLTVYKFRPAGNLDRVVEKTRLTGRLVGECDGATETADTMETELELVRDALSDEDRQEAVYYFFGFTAGSDTFVNDIVTTAGLDNVAARSGSSYFVLSAETIVAENPDWVILNSDEYDTATVPPGPNGAFTSTTAAEEGNAIVLDANEISQPAPRAVNAVLDIVKAVYPEAYREEIRGRLDSDTLGGERTVRSEALADGTLLFEARNLGRDRQVSFAAPRRANHTAQLERLNVSLRSLNPTFSLQLRPLTAAEGPAALDGTHTFSRFSLSANGLPDEDVRRFQLRFRVNESTLTARNTSAETVTLYGHNGTAWRALDTRVVERTNGTVVFQATSTTSSTFAIGAPESSDEAVVTATPTPEPTPTPTPTSTPTASSTPMPTEAASTTAQSTTSTQFPGFGLLAVVAAVLAATSAMALRRRR